MKQGLYLIAVVATLMLSSCTMRFWAYLCNNTDGPALVDVYLTDSLRPVPRNVRLANRLVRFRSGHRSHFTKTIPLQWTDSNHFSIEIPPKSTVNLEDMAGVFYNSHPRYNAKVVLRWQQKSVLLMDGRRDFNHSLFKYRDYGFPMSRMILWYDIE